MMRNPVFTEDCQLDQEWVSEWLAEAYPGLLFDDAQVEGAEHLLRHWVLGEQAYRQNQEVDTRLSVTLLPMLFSVMLLTVPEVPLALIALGGLSSFASTRFFSGAFQFPDFSNDLTVPKVQFAQLLQAIALEGGEPQDPSAALVYLALLSQGAYKPLSARSASFWSENPYARVRIKPIVAMALGYAALGLAAAYLAPSAMVLNVLFTAVPLLTLLPSQPFDPLRGILVSSDAIQSSLTPAQTAAMDEWVNLQSADYVGTNNQNTQFKNLLRIAYRNALHSARWRSTEKTGAVLLGLSTLGFAMTSLKPDVGEICSSALYLLSQYKHFHLFPMQLPLAELNTAVEDVMTQDGAQNQLQKLAAYTVTHSTRVLTVEKREGRAAWVRNGMSSLAGTLIELGSTFVLPAAVKPAIQMGVAAAKSALVYLPMTPGNTLPEHVEALSQRQAANQAVGPTAV